MLEGWKCPVCGVGVHPLEKVCPNCVNKPRHYDIHWWESPGVTGGITYQAGTDAGTTNIPSVSASLATDTLNSIAEAKRRSHEYIVQLPERERELLLGKPEC